MQLRKYLRAGGVVLLLALLGAQAVPVDRANPPVEGDVPAPGDVKLALRRACYDCHSRETRWPWYSRVAPVSWLVTRDVREGRDELDFSAWAGYSPRAQAKKLKESAEEIEEGEMPPWYYSLMHPEARLSEAERRQLIAWTIDARRRP